MIFWVEFLIIIVFCYINILSFLKRVFSNWNIALEAFETMILIINTFDPVNCINLCF